MGFTDQKACRQALSEQQDSSGQVLQDEIFQYDVLQRRTKPKMIYLVQKVRMPIITVTVVVPVSNNLKNSSQVKISANDESIATLSIWE